MLFVTLCGCAKNSSEQTSDASIQTSEDVSDTEETDSTVYKMESDGWFSDMFDLSPLTSGHVYDLSISYDGNSYDLFSVYPDTDTDSDGDFTQINNLNETDLEAKQVMLNYLENYQSNSLWDTNAGYYAVQLAIWGRVKEYDPGDLTITKQDSSAEKIRSLASELYNDHTDVSYGLVLTYNGSTDVQESYNLSGDEADSKVTLFYDNGDWYYCSKPMAIVPSNIARGVSVTITVNGEGYLTDGTQDNSNKYKTLTFNNELDDFYIVYPAEMAAGETSITITAKYNYIDAMFWESKNNKDNKLINAIVKTTEEDYSILFYRDPIENKSSK